MLTLGDALSLHWSLHVLSDRGDFGPVARWSSAHARPGHPNAIVAAMAALASATVSRETLTSMVRFWLSVSGGVDYVPEALCDCPVCAGRDPGPADPAVCLVAGLSPSAQTLMVQLVTWASEHPEALDMPMWLAQIRMARDDSRRAGDLARTQRREREKTDLADARTIARSHGFDWYD